MSFTRGDADEAATSRIQSKRSMTCSGSDRSGNKDQMPLIGPRTSALAYATSLATAAERCSGPKWAYRKVIVISEWPNSSRTVFKSTPAMTSLLAK